MPSALAPELVPYRRELTPWDSRRNYLLPDTVETNIPRRHSLGGLGAHDWARGHLAELCFRLGGVPLSLHYEELLLRPPSNPAVPGERLREGIGLQVTACLRDQHGQDVTVITRNESRPCGPRRDYWQVTVNGEIPDGADDPGLNGVHTYPPSLPYMAFLVHLHLARVRRGKDTVVAVSGKEASGFGPGDLDLPEASQNTEGPVSRARPEKHGPNALTPPPGPSTP